MNTLDTIKSMLAVRSYRADPIPEDVTIRIIQAGRLTGSSRNTQRWNFIVVRTANTLNRLGKLASTGPYIADAPLAIAVIVPDSPVGYIDGARAAQDMMLAAWDAGIGSNWVGNVNTSDIRQLLNVPPDQMVLTIIPFGYPTEQIGQGVKDRKPLSKVVHAERFGQPYNP